MFCKHCGSRYIQQTEVSFPIYKHWCSHCSYRWVYVLSNKEMYGPHKRYCILCGCLITNKNQKFCSACKSNRHLKVNPIINRRTSILWQSNNPEKVKASNLAKAHPERLLVLYECPHETNGRQKHDHHFDYTKPYEVIRLCPACHSAEHARIRRCSCSEPRCGEARLGTAGHGEAGRGTAEQGKARHLTY